MRIEYENLTQAREKKDKPEEPIKVVKEVIKHTVCKTNTSRNRKHTWKGGETGPKNYQHRRYKQGHTQFRGKKKLQNPNIRRKQKKQKEKKTYNKHTKKHQEIQRNTLGQKTPEQI